MPKWKFVQVFEAITPFLVGFRVEMAMVYVEKQFNRTASMQMSPIGLKSYWESRRLPKAAHFGPFQMR